MTDRSPDGTWRTLQAAAVLLVLGFFLFALGDLLSPFILFWVLAAVLLPFRGTWSHTVLVSTAAVLTGLWILHTTGSLLAPFVLAMVLAYVLDPFVDFLERRRLPRSVSILLLCLPVFALGGTLLFVVMPALGAQIGELIQRVPSLLQRFATWLESAETTVLRVDLPLVDEEALMERIRGVDSAAVVAFLQERQAEIASRVWTGVLGVGRGVGSLITILGYAVLTPVLTFYLLRDYDRIVAAVGGLLPRGSRRGIVPLMREYDALLSRYLRGQLLVAAVVGTITALGLWVTGFPYPFLLGAIVAVFNVVPFLGLVLSILPAIFIALVSGSIGVSLLKVLVVYALAQLIESAVVSPRVVGESVGLHPVWVLLALAMGGFFFGFVGLLIAVPGAVGIKLVVARGLARYRSSEIFHGGGTAEDAAGEEG